MLHEIQRLREIAECCHTGAPIPAESAAWLGGSLDRFLHQQSPTIEDAMGLRFARGGIPWWKEEAIRKRDAALRQLADSQFPGTGLTRTAQSIHTLALRYGASTWRFDRENDSMPQSYRGTVKAHLWAAFQSGAAMPVSERQLRNILR